MVHRLNLFTLSLIAIASLASTENAQAKSVIDSTAPQTGVVLTKLAEPEYPLVAQHAGISGDMNLTLMIRKDGSVESAKIVSGPALLLLRQAAVESARRSKFECLGCGETATEYSLTYRFRIAPSDPPKNCGDTHLQPPIPAELESTMHLVTVSAWELWTCDPASIATKVRSAKCLYLWRCGLR